MAATTPGAVRRALTTRLAALTPESGYRQYAAADAAWRGVWQVNTDTLSGAASNRAHLTFFFDDSEQEDSGHTRRNITDGFGVSNPVTLRFLFRIRPENQVEDWDAAADAALHVMRDLANFALTSADFNIEVAADGGLRRTQVEGDDVWLLVEVDFTTGYCISLTL